MLTKANPSDYTATTTICTAQKSVGGQAETALHQKGAHMSIVGFLLLLFKVLFEHSFSAGNKAMSDRKCVNHASHD